MQFYTGFNQMPSDVKNKLQPQRHLAFKYIFAQKHLVMSLQVQELCEAANAKVGSDSVRIANYLCVGNYAISGGTDGCEAVEQLAKSKGARMTVRLAVAGAFHTSYMQPAQEQLQ